MNAGARIKASIETRRASFFIGFYLFSVLGEQQNLLGYGLKTAPENLRRGLQNGPSTRGAVVNPYDCQL
jgi:hypothetical protein